MKIAHELTPADVATAQTMLRATTPPPLPNQSLIVLPGAYALGGLVVLGFIFDLPMNALIALLFYVAGLLWIVLTLLRRNVARGEKSPARGYSLQREYLITDEGLEVRAPDLRQVFPAAGIVRLASAERGTLVHLSHSSPVFLPFGSAFHADFIAALRAKTPTG
jgi:hypothetical protein